MTNKSMTKQTKHTNVNDMTRKEIESVPYRKSRVGEIHCSCLIILPQRSIHDSGYRCMDFVAVDKKSYPICRLSGCSDVVHIEGIGGYHYKWLDRYKTVPSSVPPTEWSIDCLKKSGLLRLFSTKDGIICGSALSSFEVYSEPKDSK